MDFGLVSAKERTPLPLKDVCVDAEIRGYLLGLKSTLKYENASPDPVEVMFRFPLEQSHAVVGLTAVIDGRKIRAQLKEKEEAKMQYDDAIASGQTAALAEEKSGDIFSVSLGNLPPQKEAEIILQLVGELPIDAEGAVRFSLPATLKPRYVPHGSMDPLESVTSGSDDQVVRASASSVQKFRLSVFNQEDMEEVSSPTHLIAVSREADVAVVTLSGSDKSLRSDMVILIKHKDPHAPKALVEPGKEAGNSFMKQSAVMVNFFPEFPDIPSQACEFIFLVDRSGSMTGSFINSARETLLLFLKSLPDDCHFNIVGFGSSYEKLFREGSVPYSQATLDTATSHTKKMHANLGGTELLPPLKDILGKKPPSGLARQVFVLTDGAVSNTQACIDVVKKNIAHSRCFTFGIGSGASTVLVEGLARAGNGSSEFIKEGERMQPKVIRSLKRAMQPAATNVSVRFDLKVPKITTTYKCPDKLPPVYAGEKMVVYGLAGVPNDQKCMEGTAILSGEIIGKHFQHKIPFSSQLDPTECTGTYPTHRLAAKALISDWNNAGKSKATITSLSVDSSVISSYTAFIAVDEESSTPVESSLQTWDITACQLQVSNLCLASSAMTFGGGGSGPMFRSAPGGSGPMFRSAPGGSGPMFRSAPGGSGPMFRSAPLGGPAYGMGMGPPSVPGSAPPSSALYCTIDPQFISHVKSGMPATASRSRSAVRSSIGPAEIPPSPRAAQQVSSSSPAEILSSLIAVQQADGSWMLDSFLSAILSKSLKEIEGACPVKLEKGGALSVIWATVLVLTILETKCKGQQEEWELIAMKANKWLKRQVLPEGVDINVFRSSAQTLM